MALSYVCDDVNGDTRWMYDPAAQTYVRYRRDKAVAGVIAGQYLPDPMVIWQQRCANYQVEMGSPESDVIKPQQATFALWNHWQGVK